MRSIIIQTTAIYVNFPPSSVPHWEKSLGFYPHPDRILEGWKKELTFKTLVCWHLLFIYKVAVCQLASISLLGFIFSEQSWNGSFLSLDSDYFVTPMTQHLWLPRLRWKKYRQGDEFHVAFITVFPSNFVHLTNEYPQFEQWCFCKHKIFSHLPHL